jgi:flagellar biosynthesis/type III secretory pathway ATPase
VATAAHLDAARQARELLATYEQHRDLITLGAYKRGSDARVDHAIARIDRLEAYLRQGTHDAVSFADAVAGLAVVARG